jgi:cell wall-associated NlpC family hydrolase
VPAQAARRDTQEPEETGEAPSGSHATPPAQARQGSRHGARRAVAEAPAPEAASDIVRTAYSYRGTPYVYGGASRGGFDCSGFTSYLYGKRGVALPHTARGQFAMGRKVERGDLKPGDLVFFQTVTPGISHVGVYVGNGQFIHASSRRSGGVRVDSLDSGYYKEHFRGARRMGP